MRAYNPRRCLKITNVKIHWLVHMITIRRFVIFISFSRVLSCQYLEDKSLKLSSTNQQRVLHWDLQNHEIGTCISGMGSLGQLGQCFPFSYFSTFFIFIKTRVNHWITYWYFTDVAAAQQWLHLPNMNAIQNSQPLLLYTNDINNGEINE